MAFKQATSRTEKLLNNGGPVVGAVYDRAHFVDSRESGRSQAAPRMAFPEFFETVSVDVRQESEKVAARLRYVEARDHIMVSIAPRKRPRPIAFNWHVCLRQYHRCSNSCVSS